MSTISAQTLSRQFGEIFQKVPANYVQGEDDDLQDDIDTSFASTVSLNSPSGDHRTFETQTFNPSFLHSSPHAMDICAPTPLDPRQASSAREFGRDAANDYEYSLFPLRPPPLFYKLTLPPSNLASPAATLSGGGQSTAKGCSKGRSALSTSWAHPSNQSNAPHLLPSDIPRFMRLQGNQRILDSDVDMMDLDSPCPRPPTTLFFPAPSVPQPNFHDSSSKSSNDVLAAYFHEETPEPIKRTSTFPIMAYNARPAPPEPAPPNHGPPSSSPSSSPAARKFERSLSAQLAQPTARSKETHPQNSGPSFRQLKQRPLSVALSTIMTKGIEPQPRSAGVVPSARMKQRAPRRAVSAFIQPGFRVPSGVKQGRLRMMAAFGEDDDGESGAETGAFDSPSTKVQVGRMIKGASIGGTSDMKAMGARLPPVPALGQSPGLPGFGDNEMDGKILPCQRVKDDGLMRITPQTLCDLISGFYDSQIASYRVIDCRFDYEYAGGHVPGAVNLNTIEAIEGYILNRPNLPAPSRSGDRKGTKHILVFHCEFSAKRGPTFAKHMRAKDRALNGHVYPNIHFPEVYILLGGYNAFWSIFPDVCEPRGYVTMDDPVHSRARTADLNQFRRWNRTRSYTYGERAHAAAVSSKSLLSEPMQKPKTMPGTLPTINNVVGVAATKSASYRRGGTITGVGLHTLEEDDRHGGKYGTAGAAEPSFECGEGDISFSTDGDDAESSFQEGDVSVEAEDPTEPNYEGPCGDTEDEEVDDFEHVESSPCVTAGIAAKKKKNELLRGIIGKTFKPLNFSKRGMERAATFAN